MLSILRERFASHMAKYWTFMCHSGPAMGVSILRVRFTSHMAKYWTFMCHSGPAMGVSILRVRFTSHLAKYCTFMCHNGPTMGTLFPRPKNLQPLSPKGFFQIFSPLLIVTSDILISELNSIRKSFFKLYFSYRLQQFFRSRGK